KGIALSQYYFPGERPISARITVVTSRYCLLTGLRCFSFKHSDSSSASQSASAHPTWAPRTDVSGVFLAHGGKAQRFARRSRECAMSQGNGKVKVKMVAEFVTQGAQECTERGDIFPYCCPHPDANQHCFRMIVSEE